MKRLSLRLAGYLIGLCLLLGVKQSAAQITPQFNTPVQVSIEMVYLNWPPFSGAQQYQIYWSSSPGVDLTSTMIPIGSASTLGYNHVGLTSGATYYYRIRALDAFSNWTLLSNEVAVTVPITPTEWYGGGVGDGHSSTFLCNSLLNGTPAIPTFDNVLVYRSAEHNRIAWLQYPGATSYLVEVSNTAAGPWSTLANTANLFFEHTNLIGNTAFYYRVTPLGASGCAVNPSAEVEAIVIPNNNSHSGGAADGHANLLICSSLLDGTPAPPPTPDFVVYEGIQELFIFWSPVAGAASYNLEFSTTSATGPWAPLATNFVGTNFTHTSLVAGQTYFYRLRANPTSGCPFAWSNTFSGVPRPLIEATGVAVGGGVGDGHAALRTCPMFLDGTFNSPNSQAISVYMSTEQNYIAWPQQSGAVDYTVEFATSAGGPWSLLITTAALAATHTPPAMVVGTQYFYRVTANLTTGCPLNPSVPVAMFGLPTYNNLNCGGGIADGHAALRTCPMFLDGVFDSPLSQPISVYSSMEQNLIAWPQQTGAIDYTVEFATAAAGPWNILSNTTALSFVHQPASLVVGTTYFYRVRANLTGGCPLNPSLAVTGVGVPQYSWYGGGEADGHARATTCPILLSGLPDAAQSPVPTAYPSQDFVYVSWPQVPGAFSYLLEVSTDGGLTWNTLANSTVLFFQHNVVGGTDYTYRLTALLNTGCPLLPSNAFTATPAPSYNFYFGGIADGHANARSCTFVTLDQSTVYILGATTFCFGDSVKLKASQAVLYTWYKDGVPIPGGTLDSLVVTQSGIYTVETFNIFSCSAASLEIDVTVHPLPPDPPLPIADPAGLSCGPVELVAVGNPSPNQYYWQGTNPNGFDTNYPGNVPFIANTSGTYYLRTISSENCWSDGLSEVTVSIMPVPTLISPNTQTTYCEIGSVNAWNYLVDVNGKAIAAIQNNANALQGVDATVFVTQQLNNRFDGNNEFLGRHYLINTAVQPVNPVRVRLYFSQDELDNLITQSSLSPSPFDDIVAIGDLIITKYQGPTEDGIYDMSDATDISVIIPDLFGADLNGLFVEFSTGSFSEFWIHGNNIVPLPVELLYFNGKCAQANITFEWATASETNSHYFQLEGSEELVVWHTLGVLMAAGNSNHVINYSHIWPASNNQLKYFRLKQVDLNGDVAFSDVIVKDCLHNHAYSFDLLYASSHGYNTVDIAVQNNSREPAILEIFDASGRLIYQASIMLQDGTSSYAVALHEHSRGLYLVRVKKYNDQRSLKFFR
ncbi:MAG: hypothetical protein ACK4GL_04765 [Flavobacteriales bacterium]